MLVKLLCPQCGAAMEIDDQQEQIYCSHCGTKIANIREKVEITQNVNVSGTVRHVMDRSNEPNLYISYATANPSVVMVVRIVDTGTKNTYLNGQTQTYHLRQGRHDIVLKIGKKNYNRTIIIPEDNAPVRINAAFTGRRAEITIDQPTVGNEYQQALSKNNSGGKGQSALAIISFILSLTGFGAILGIPLAIWDMIRWKKDQEHKHGLAVAALVIGLIFGLIAIPNTVKCSGQKSQTSYSTHSPATKAPIALSSPTAATVEAGDPIDRSAETANPVIEAIPEATASVAPTATLEPETPASAEETAATGIRPEFQKMMDEYLQFFKEYCDFMKKYMKSPDVSMMTQYYEMMQHYLEATEALDEINEDDLSKEELKLYLDTINEINKMLIDLS